MSKHITLKYNPSHLSPGLVHIGWGNFARSFLGEYAHDVACMGEKKWGVFAIAPSDRQRRDIQNLHAQNCIYHLIKRNSHETCVPVGALLGIHIGKHAPLAVVDRLSHPDTKVVTLTITQAGYHTNLNKELRYSEDIQRDIKNIHQNKLGNISTVLGWLIAGLHNRYKNGKPPFTVMSCDNIPQNGRMVKNVLLAFADAIDNNFFRYLANNLCCPNSVVDRVTPHQNYYQNSQYITSSYNVSNDNCPVVCEPYRRFIIEDSFVNQEKPPFDRIDTQNQTAFFVDDVSPHEDCKIRLLNGSHLAIGLVSKLLQIPTVLEAVHDPLVRNYWLSFLRQAAEPIRPLPISGYVQDTIDRLDNPHLTDQTDRLLSDTTAKIRARLFNMPALSNGKETDTSAFALGVWLRYMEGRDESGNPFNVHANDAGKLEGLELTSPLSIKQNLPRLLTKDESLQRAPKMTCFVNRVCQYNKHITSIGLRETLKRTFAMDPA